MSKFNNNKVVTIGVMCVSIASAILECIKALNAEDTETMVNRIIDERLGNSDSDDLK